MRKLFGLVLLVLVLPLAFCGCGGDSGGGGGGGGDFVGTWKLTEANGSVMYITYNDDGSYIMKDCPDCGPHMVGTYDVDGSTASGPFNNPGVGEGETVATITGDGSMSMDFIEHWHSPYKHVPMAGTKL